MEGSKVRIVSSDGAGDQEEDGARAFAAAAHRAAATALTALVGDWGQARELGDGLVGEDADLGQLGHETGAMPATSLAKRPVVPIGSIWASSQSFEISIPQRVLFTVTCLVRAIGAKRLFGRA